MAHGLSEERLRLAADLYEARRAARWLLGADYGARIAAWMQLVRAAMARESKPPLSAALVLVKLSDDPMHHLFLMAAAVEVIESASVEGVCG